MSTARILPASEWPGVWPLLDGVEDMWPEFLWPDAPELDVVARHSWSWRADDDAGLLAVLVCVFLEGDPELHLWTRRGANLRELSRLAIVVRETFSASGVAPRAYIEVRRRAAWWLAQIAGITVEAPDGQQEKQDAEAPARS